MNGAAARFERLPQSLLDPYAGAGTALAAARAAGIPSAGIEIGQLGVLIAQTRLDPPAELQSVLEAIDAIADDQNPPDAHDHPHADELAQWLGDEGVTRLLRYLELIERIDDDRDRRFATLALSAALRPASNWLAGSIKPQRDASRIPASLPLMLKRTSRAIARDVRVERGPSHVPAVPLRGDAGLLPFNDRSFEVVVTSPPYFVAYDYLDVHRLSYLAFGWDRPAHLQLGRRAHVVADGAGFLPPASLAGWYEVYRRESTRDGRALRLYVQSLRRHLREIHRVLVPGGVVALAVANSVRMSRRFDLVGGMRELLGEVGFADVEARPRASSNRRILPAGRDLATGRFSDRPTRAVIERLVFARKR